MEKLIRTIKVIIYGIKSLINHVLEPYKDEKFIKWSMIIFFWIIFIKIVFFWCVVIEVAIKYYNLPGEYVDVMDIKNKQKKINDIYEANNNDIFNTLYDSDRINKLKLINNNNNLSKEKTVQDINILKKEEFIREVLLKDKKSEIFYPPE